MVKERVCLTMEKGGTRGPFLRNLGPSVRLGAESPDRQLIPNQTFKVPFKGLPPPPLARRSSRRRGPLEMSLLGRNMSKYFPYKEISQKCQRKTIWEKPMRKESSPPSRRSRRGRQKEMWRGETARRDGTGGPGRGLRNADPFPRWPLRTAPLPTARPDNHGVPARLCWRPPPPSPYGYLDVGGGGGKNAAMKGSFQEQSIPIFLIIYVTSHVTSCQLEGAEPDRRIRCCGQRTPSSLFFRRFLRFPRPKKKFGLFQLVLFSDTNTQTRVKESLKGNKFLPKQLNEARLRQRLARSIHLGQGGGGRGGGTAHSQRMGVISSALPGLSERERPGTCQD